MNDFQTGLVLTSAAVGTGAGCFISGIIAKIWDKKVFVPLCGTGITLLFLSVYFFPSKASGLHCCFSLPACFAVCTKFPLMLRSSEKFPDAIWGTCWPIPIKCRSSLYLPRQPFLPLLRTTWQQKPYSCSWEVLWALQPYLLYFLSIFGTKIRNNGF